jgi:50S ribosomal subunit-associated GTPase HflX
VSRVSCAQIPVVLVGNKIDLEEERVVSLEEGRDLAKKHRLSHFETSAKTNHNINEVFFCLGNHPHTHHRTRTHTRARTHAHNTTQRTSGTNGGGACVRAVREIMQWRGKHMRRSSVVETVKKKKKGCTLY